MKNRNFICLAITTLSISIVLTGCYSYRPITNDQLLFQNGHNKLKFVLNDQSEIIVNEEDQVNIVDHTIVITTLDSTQHLISFNDVINMYEEKFDFVKTFFAGFWTLIGLIIVLGLLIGNSLRMG